MHAIVMAGGRGTRLAPYTTVLPKPLIPVGDMPILELLLRQLESHGIKQISLAVGYLAPLLMAYFDDGKRQGVKITYCIEKEPLGTAGAMRLVGGIAGTFLVLNGDLLTDIDFNKLIEFHRSQKAAATVGLFQRNVKIDLGVVTTDPAQVITDYIEKPVYEFKVSMGVYVFEPSVIGHIPAAGAFDLPQLITALKRAGEKVVGYTHDGYWLDIGRPDDFERAQHDVDRILKFARKA